MGKKGTTHRKFNKKENMKYIQLHLEKHLSVMQIESEYGIRNSLVSSWVKRHLEDGEDALDPHAALIPPDIFVDRIIQGCGSHAYGKDRQGANEPKHRKTNAVCNFIAGLNKNTIIIE